MNWTDVMKASALAASSGSKVAAVQTPVDVPWGCNPRDVWLNRVRPARERVARSSPGGLMTPRPQANAPGLRNHSK
jgi:hypothetical protein